MKISMPLVALVLVLAGCRETPADTAEDVAQAQAEAAEEVRQARAKRAQVQRDAREQDDTQARQVGPVMGVYDEAERRAQADFEVAEAEAAARRDIEREKCDALVGDEHAICNDAADAEYDKAAAEAELERAHARQAASPRDQFE